jgi:type 1 glutamine amidotransferase
MSQQMNRRDLLSLAALAGAGLALGPVARTFGQAASGEKKKLLFFTKSTGFQHSVIQRKNGELGFAEKILQDLGAKNGYDVVCSKDGNLLAPDKIGQWDGFVFYTTEDLTKPSPEDKNKSGSEPPIPAGGKEALLKAIADGKGFMGFHCASDTFHSSKRPKPGEQMLRDEQVADNRDPYIKMIGGEFAGHGSQQKATQKVISRAFPGLEDIQDFGFQEEWYNLMNISDDLHVILAQDTSSMKSDKGGDAQYKRPNYPSTWARMHGKGRVFYTSMGHREDVWTNPLFQKFTLAGLAWITGRTQFEPKANVREATPEIPVLAAAR